jgi:hypothetical protein
VVVLWGIAFLIPVPGVQVSPGVLLPQGFPALKAFCRAPLFPFCSHLQIIEGGHRRFEGGRRQVRIALDHLRALVAQERPDDLQGLTTHSQATGKGVTEIMEAKGLDAGPFQSAMEGAVNPQEACPIWMTEEVG